MSRDDYELPGFDDVTLAGDYKTLRRTESGRQILAERLQLKGYSDSLDLRRRDIETRPFISWDGEGANDSNGRHQYILFGNSSGYEIESESLTTQECLDLIFATEVQAPNSFHIIFAGKYDVNMILRDCHYMTLDRLHRTGRAQYGGYRLGYAPGKYFSVARGDTTATIFDVWAFFACSFVQACVEYLGESELLTRIEAGKKRRSSFTFADLPYIREYFRSELGYLVRLLQTLREHLLAAGISLSKWHGPGAISSKILSTHGIKHHMQETPPEVIRVVQHAYAGGHSEQFEGGVHLGEIHVQDANSMYPAFIAQLPSLRGSSWEHVSNPATIDDFGIYRVSARTPFLAAHDAKPYPLFWRGRHGEVYYPKDIEGWYWGVEVRLLTEYQCYDQWHISEAWLLHTTEERPFSFIPHMYDQRREWKDAGNPAQIAYRLGLNSVYGKQAQRIGAHKGGPPTWHQLEWSGWTTAASRAHLFRAIRQRAESLISCSTDSVFSTERLDLPTSTDLGEWDYNLYHGIIAMQSGVYWLRTDDPDTKRQFPADNYPRDSDGLWWKPKYRGFDKGSLNAADALAYLSRLDMDPAADPLEASSTRFMTWSQTRGSQKWRQWLTTPRQLVFGSPLSKRGHYPRACPECQSGASLTEELHTFYTCGLPWIGKSMSAAHTLPWSEYGDDGTYPDYEEDMVTS